MQAQKRLQIGASRQVAISFSDSFKVECWFCFSFFSSPFCFLLYRYTPHWRISGILNPKNLFSFYFFLDIWDWWRHTELINYADKPELHWVWNHDLCQFWYGCFPNRFNTCMLPAAESSPSAAKAITAAFPMLW